MIRNDCNIKMVKPVPCRHVAGGGLVAPGKKKETLVEQADRIIGNFKNEETKQKALDFLEYLADQEKRK